MSVPLVLDDRDQSVVYANGCITEGSPQEHDSTTSRADSKGLTATLKFNGTSVAVFGTISSNANHRAPSTLYKIDDQDPTNFEPSIPSSILYKQKFFGVTNLTPEVHTLVIKNMLDNAPVWLDYFEITPIPASTTQVPGPDLSSTMTTSVSTSSLISQSFQSTATHLPTSLPPSQPQAPQSTVTVTSMLSIQQTPASAPALNSEASKISVSAVVGAAIGGASFGALVVIVAIMLYRSRHKRTKIEDLQEVPVPLFLAR